MKQTILMLFLLTAIVTVLVACGGTGTATTETWRIEFFDPTGESVGMAVIQLTTRKMPGCDGVIAMVIETKMIDTDQDYPIGREACAGISATDFAADLNYGVVDNNTLVGGIRSGDQASGEVIVSFGPEGIMAGTFKAYRVSP